MLHSILLQIVNSGTVVADSASQVVNQVAASPLGQLPIEKELSLMDFIVKGGIIMIPIGILLIMVLFFFFERLITLSKAGKLDKNFMHHIKDYIHSGNTDAAKALCKSSVSPVARMIEKGISRIGKPIKEIEEAMESTGKLEINRMEKNLSVLSVVGRIAPIFGFVGTIIGVILIFYKINLAKGDFSIETVSEGLYQKMIASASGLLVGLLAYMGYYIVNSILDRNINKMETATVEFIDLLQEPTK